MFEKISTWLPVFHGFYGSGLEDDDDMQYTLFNEPDKIDEKHRDWLLENAFDYINYSDYHNAMAVEICHAVSEELESHGLIKSFEFENLVSPKYYNFSNDSIDVIFEVDIKSLIEKCQQELEEFEEYIKQCYTSYDGFSSHYSNDPANWLSGEYIEENANHCVGSLLRFLLCGDNDNNYQDLVYEATSEVYIGEFIDFDKMLEDFNEEFGTDCKSMEDVENAAVDPEELARRDIEGQKFIEFEK